MRKSQKYSKVCKANNTNQSERFIIELHNDDNSTIRPIKAKSFEDAFLKLSKKDREKDGSIIDMDGHEMSFCFLNIIA